MWSEYKATYFRGILVFITIKATLSPHFRKWKDIACGTAVQLGAKERMIVNTLITKGKYEDTRILSRNVLDLFLELHGNTTGKKGFEIPLLVHLKYHARHSCLAYIYTKTTPSAYINLVKTVLLYSYATRRPRFTPFCLLKIEGEMKLRQERYANNKSTWKLFFTIRILYDFIGRT